MQLIKQNLIIAILGIIALVIAAGAFFGSSENSPFMMNIRKLYDSSVTEFDEDHIGESGRSEEGQPLIQGPSPSPSKDNPAPTASPTPSPTATPIPTPTVTPTPTLTSTPISPQRPVITPTPTSSTRRTLTP